MTAGRQWCAQLDGRLGCAISSLWYLATDWVSHNGCFSCSHVSGSHSEEDSLKPSFPAQQKVKKCLFGLEPLFCDSDLSWDLTCYMSWGKTCALSGIQTPRGLNGWMFSSCFATLLLLWAGGAFSSFLEAAPFIWGCGFYSSISRLPLGFSLWYPPSFTLLLPLGPPLLLFFKKLL